MTASVPTYTERDGQAITVINGREYDLGEYGSDKSRQHFDRLVAEYDALGRPPYFGLPTDDVTVATLAEWYLAHADGYYASSGPRGEVANIRNTLKYVLSLYSDLPACEFCAFKLQAVRGRMISARLCRTYINASVQRTVRMFRWAVAQGLVPPDLAHGLSSLDGLRRGRSIAREPVPVKPVATDVVDATLTELSTVVRGMVEFQRHTGCRPIEVCLVRPCDVDRSGDVWEYRPHRHKTQHHGKERVIFIGPKAQEALRPFLLRSADSYCFSPDEAAREHREKLTLCRRTPLSCGNRVGTNRKANPQRRPDAMYVANTYRNAIYRACDRLGIPRWSPNRLRHSAATKIRREFGLEAAQTVLGHSQADVTQMYAERDFALAASVAKAVG